MDFVGHSKDPKERDKQEDAVILQLQNAAKEIEETGEISQELKQRIFAADPGFESIWEAIGRVAQQRMSEPTISRMCKQLSSEERSWVLSSHMVTFGIGLLEELAQSRYSAVREIAIAQHVEMLLPPVSVRLTRGSGRHPKLCVNAVFAKRSQEVSVYEWLAICEPS